MKTALRRVLTLAVLGVTPLAVVITMFVVALQTESLAVDFQNELYPEAKAILSGNDPFPHPNVDLSAGKNLIWPPLAALLIAPLTVLPSSAANIVIAALGLLCFALSLWLVGVRDWRVYGAFTLWPLVVGEMRVSHLTPALCLLVAVAWRYRSAPLAVRRTWPTPAADAGTGLVAGVAIGVASAIKFFLWPLGLWLLATGRRAAATTAAVVAGASLLLVLPFTGLDDYARTLFDLGRTFDQDSYSVFGLLVQAGASETFARSATLGIGVALLAAMWRSQSLALAVAAALVLSPIVWLDYYAVTAVPLAVVRPTLSPIWLVPLATWGLLGAGIGSGDAWGSGRVLVAFGLVVLVTVRAERAARRISIPHAHKVRGFAGRRVGPRSSSN